MTAGMVIILYLSLIRHCGDSEFMRTDVNYLVIRDSEFRPDRQLLSVEKGSL